MNGTIGSDEEVWMRPKNSVKMMHYLYLYKWTQVDAHGRFSIYLGRIA
jgi:hypothetical protein